MTGTDPESRAVIGGAPPRVVIVDDHLLFRSGVRAELAEYVDVVGEAGSVADAIATIRVTVPDVVLLDVHMPDGGGLAIIAEIAREQPAVRFLALSVSDAPQDVIELVRAGARGYVTKTIAPAELAEAVIRVAAGDVVLSPRLAGFVLDVFAGDAHQPADPELDQLTRREVEVLELIARGYLYKEVAQRLGVSRRTVETHVSAVLRKLHLSNRHQLARWAAQRRLVD
jgi:DNA-binding NarL/FixJ family response regulator